MPFCVRFVALRPSSSSTNEGTLCRGAPASNRLAGWGAYGPGVLADRARRRMHPVIPPGQGRPRAARRWPRGGAACWLGDARLRPRAGWGAGGRGPAGATAKWGHRAPIRAGAGGLWANLLRARVRADAAHGGCARHALHGCRRLHLGCAVESYVLVSLGVIGSAACGFFLSRFVVRPQVQRIFSNRQEVQRICAAVGQQGFRVALLCRLSLVLPTACMGAGQNKLNPGLVASAVEEEKAT
ncbi:unnamed protein product [Prorocentrum cordatum]|uniref:Uncharacterized protein n=1 Tax=Prorocentrum cordatum TaxID=2364126 RepID=A0ABN9V8N1_9DINO|nr:unnamed protein product [Polarella glacialis]